jgi:mRNA-degrading endonuclease RelE of RelBE toxin-antitoxin system
MVIEYAKDFDKSVKKIKDNIALKRLKALIEKLKQTKRLHDVPNVKPLQGHLLYYRIRTGDFRLIVKAKDIDLIEILLIEYLKRDDNTYRNYN